MRGALTPGPTLETGRLVLRPPVEGDLDGWCAMSERARPLAWRSMAAVAGSWALRGFGLFAVLERATGRFVGSAGPWCPEAWPGTEIAWSVVPTQRGRGYATEAAGAAIDWAVLALGWTEIVHLIAPDNHASAAVATRLGATRRGPVALPPPLQDSQAVLWGQTAAEWRDRR